MSLQHAVEYNSNARLVICRGDWDVLQLPHLQSALNQLSLPIPGEISVEGSDIKKMDSAGAWLLTKWRDRLEKKGVQVQLINFAEKWQKLIDLINKDLKEETELPERKKLNKLASIGQSTIEQIQQMQDYLAFIGKLTFETLRISPHLSRWRYGSLAGVIYRNGFQALPIIALLSFMIGVVLTYQMGLQLKNYGANIYIVDLLGLSVLREFAPLLTAIMVAGRTGSAYTAQLGIMKLNQEIDALDTMGVTPAELLLLPRIIGLILVLPLLTIWADIFGVIGGMVMANNMLDITWYNFLQRFSHVIPLKTLLLGLGKTPVFAFIIATVGCFQGMQVKGNANSVGQNTTRSVVLAIFFIILADALFSVVFSKLKL